MTAPQKPDAAPPSPLGLAADRLRESARWLVIAFGAVAAVVFAGIGIAGFGSVDPDTAPVQFWAALIGAACALLGVLGALLTAMSLASASSLSIAELLPEPGKHGAMRAVRTALEKDPILKPWGNDVGDFVVKLGEAASEYDTNLTNWAGSSKLQADPAYANRASERLSSLGRVQTVVMDTASYLRLRYRFTVARWFIAGFFVLATAGAITFVVATGAAATESVPVRAAAATWAVPPDDQDGVKLRLGAACSYDLNRVPAVILGDQGDGKEADIVTAAATGCAPVRLVVSSTQLVRG